MQVGQATSRLQEKSKSRSRDRTITLLGLQIAGIGTLMTGINFYCYNFKNESTRHDTYENANVYMVIINYNGHYYLCIPSFTVALALMTFDRLFGSSLLHDGGWRNANAMGKLILALGSP